MKKILLYSLGILVLTGSAGYTAICPCGPMPGIWVSGELVEAPVEDWSFANSAGLCQLEVTTWKPHALNLNCMSDANKLYVSCSNCEGKTWSSYVTANSPGKIKISESVYPVVLNRVTDQAHMDAIWAARAAKLDREGERPDHWWSFELASP